MTDLHTHILPGMDDGARNVAESISLLRMEYEQGVDTVVLTPHFYRERETIEHFLQRRKRAVDALKSALANLSTEEQGRMPKLLLGAEVAMVPNMAQWEQLSELCIGQTKSLLLELPFVPWSRKMVDQIYSLISRTGVTPVIAHLERYLKCQRQEMIADVLDLGLPVQITGEALSHHFGCRKILSMLQTYDDWLVASDCHRVDSRPPVMKQAKETLEKKLDISQAGKILRLADELAGI